MKILVAVPTGERGRNSDFYDYYNTLDLAEGTVRAFAHGASPAHNRNEMVELAMNNGCTHIFFLDDDMAPAADIVKRLAAHNLDIVSGLYLGRSFPHMPVFFDKAYENGLCKYAALTPGRKGLQKGVNCGFGCVLINLDVFKRMEKPYVRLGEIIKDEWCDDVGFFNRVRPLGYDIYCDFDVIVGHNHTVTIFPKMLENGTWVTEYRVNGGNIQITQVIPTDEEIKKQELELVKA